MPKEFFSAKMSLFCQYCDNNVNIVIIVGGCNLKIP